MRSTRPTPLSMEVDSHQANQWKCGSIKSEILLNPKTNRSKTCEGSWNRRRKTCSQSTWRRQSKLFRKCSNCFPRVKKRRRNGPKCTWKAQDRAINQKSSENIENCWKNIKDRFSTISRTSSTNRVRKDLFLMQLNKLSSRTKKVSIFLILRLNTQILTILFLN